MVMAERKGTSTPKQEQEPTTRMHIPRVVVVVLLVSLIAASMAVFFYAGYIDNRAVLWGIRAVGILTIIGALWRLIRIGYDYQWTGLGEAELPKQENVEYRPKKTLWDWLQLLIVPFALVVIGFLFTVQQDARQQKIEDQRAQAAQELEEQRAQDEALQAFLDQMGQLLLEKDLRTSEEGSEVRTLAKARTVTALQRLDANHNRIILRFLREAKLIRGGHSVVNLTNADLQGAELRGADLNSINLEGADLTGADLTGANLSYTYLHSTQLERANLQRADLTAAVLNDAKDTDDPPANLQGADLTSAVLKGAKVTDEQLAKCKTLAGATMPNGQKYEDWLKSRGEDGENSGTS